MKVNNPNLSSAASTGAAVIQGPARTSGSAGGGVSGPGGAASSDGVHLSDLVRNLRSQATASPEHQARVNQVARSYASGTYQVDAQATASRIVDDALRRP